MSERKITEHFGLTDVPEAALKVWPSFSAVRTITLRQPGLLYTGYQDVSRVEGHE